MRKILARSLISLFFIALLFWCVKEDIPRILQVLRNINRPLLTGAVIIFVATVFIMAKRLEMVFKAEEIPIKFTDVSNLSFVGFFFNNFLPTSVGGDIVKALCAARVTGEPVKSVTSVLMDRIFGLFTFIMIPSFSLLFFVKEIQDPRVPVLVYSFLACSLFFFFLLFNRNIARRFKFIEVFLNYFKLGAKVRKIYDGLHKFKNHKMLIVKALFLSVAGQSLNIFVLYLMAVAMGVQASLTNLFYFFLLVPVVHLISMVPSLNGLGVREWAYIQFLTPHFGREYAAAIGVLWLALLFLLSLIGGVIYFLRHDYHIRFKEIAK
ncbi:MAG: hypothetical protein AUJ72_02985 [Candidatus Omnitrophica bacterium CG1_02_46_14]|nr:MAG: hypothetical protein AUJ72_02985 [Candidatus Omnitrophica bacterium CG1_02_46_14]